MNKYRRIVRVEDVMTFGDINKRAAQYEMAEAKEKYGKKGKDKITAWQFCEAQNYDYEEFLKIMELDYSEKKLPK